MSPPPRAPSNVQASLDDDRAQQAAASRHDGSGRLAIGRSLARPVEGRDVSFSEPTNLVMAKNWIDRKAALFVSEASARGVTFGQRVASKCINDRVSVVAAGLGVSAMSARRYFDDGAVRGLARSAAADYRHEAPGADLLALPRDREVSLRLVGQVIAALAEANSVLRGLPREDLVEVGSGEEVIRAFATMLTETEVGCGVAASVRVPAALLERASRFLAVAGVKVEPDGYGRTARSVPNLAVALRRDAARLATSTR